MSQGQSVNDLLNGSSGPPGFKFDKIGDTVKGIITKLDVQQARDFNTQKPRFYDDGNPIMQIVVTLRKEDGEETRLFCKPALKEAIREAVTKAGADGLAINGRLAVQHHAEEQPEVRGMNPKKLFQAQYEAPSKAISADELL